MNVTWDTETYPNVFLLNAVVCDTPFRYSFEISEWCNQSRDIIEWVRSLTLMYGFNSLSFDYPLLHMLMKMGKADAPTLYEKAQQLIQSENKFEHMVYPSDRYVPQIDLFKVHHFDNKARTTNLKAIEFNMRMDNISDLPYPVGSMLTRDQVQVLREYCFNDVEATERFRIASMDQIRFRENLTAKYGRDMMNHNDAKIGSEIFQIALEQSGVECYSYGRNGRQPRQTNREYITLSECIPQWVEFANPEFQRIKSWFNQQIISETKGVFKDVIARVGGLDFVFGTGGLHASVENKTFTSDDEWMIIDVDVVSLYPSIAIEHGHYPEHLGPKFVEVYRDLRTQRLSYAKNTPENAALKISLNGTYGKSNDKFSIFYDPRFTMTITLSGQMMIAKLAEMFLSLDQLQIIQTNTDGVTIYIPRSLKDQVMEICKQWEQMTKLSLEYVEYRKMVIKDCNNYIAVYE